MAGGAVIWGARLEVPVKRGAHFSCYSRLDRTRMGPTQSTKQEEGHEQE